MCVYVCVCVPVFNYAKDLAKSVLHMFEKQDTLILSLFNFVLYSGLWRKFYTENELKFFFHQPCSLSRFDVCTFELYLDTQ